MGDCISFIFLICALSACMTYSLNRIGYDFKVIDTIMLCLAGIVVFLVPYGIVSLIASLI